MQTAAFLRLAARLFGREVIRLATHCRPWPRALWDLGAGDAGIAYSGKSLPVEPPRYTMLDEMRDLLVREIRDLYSAERQLADALPQMMAAATHQDLKDAIAQH